MTVAIAAKFEAGIICATDSSIHTGNSRMTLPYIKGEYVYEGFAMYAGCLATAQAIARSAQDKPLLAALDDVDWDDGDDADFLVVTQPDLAIFAIDSSGAIVGCDEWGATGHGSDSARMLLEALYKPRSESYVTSTLKTIIQIIQKYDSTVYGPVRFEVIRNA